MRKLALACAAVVVALFALEAVCRLAGLHGEAHEPHVHTFLRDEDGPLRVARYGFVPLATHRTTYHTDPRGYFAPDTSVDHVFNSAGWRDEEHTLAKPAGTYRILGLGDSYLMGQGVHREDMFFHRFEDLLNDATEECKVETINTGISGNNTRQEANLFRERGLTYDPDLVIIHFVPNDVEEDLSAAGPLIEFYRNYTTITQDRDWLSDYSQLWAWTRGNYLRAVRGRDYIRKSLARFEANSSMWQKCRSAIDEIVAGCRQRDVRIMLVMLPFFYDLDGDYPFQPIHDRVAEYCRQQDLLFLDLREAYRDYHGPELWVHPTDQHPNEKANEIAARVMAEFVVDHAEEVRLGQPRDPRHAVDDETLLQAHARIVQLGGGLSEAGDVLNFAANPVTDYDLALLTPYLAALSKVRSLSLRNSEAGDRTIADWGEILVLRNLDLSYSMVTPAGIRHLEKLTQLEQLGLEGLLIGDESLPHIGKLTKLTILNLTGTGITDDGLRHLSDLTQLESLYLGVTDLSAKGIRTVLRLPQLKQLGLPGDRITPEDVRALQSAAPGVTLIKQ